MTVFIEFITNAAKFLHIMWIDRLKLIVDNLDFQAQSVSIINRKCNKLNCTHEWADEKAQ
jgi:hypothetical protein